MITILRQAVNVGVLSLLDIHFACVVAQEAPDILLAAACLSAAVASGHVCLTLDQLQVGQLFGGQQQELAHTAWVAAGKPDIASWSNRLMLSAAVGDGSSATPLVLNGQRLYLQRMWQSEGDVAAFISSASKHRIVVDESQLINILDKLFGVSTADEPNWQKIAAALAMTRRIAVISGGPGTGKTTTVAKILLALVQLNDGVRLRIQLAAPTGKAAARLTESLGMVRQELLLTPAQHDIFPTEAFTLHRLLGVEHNSQRMRYHRGNRLHLDVLVIDEASMVDLSMMAHLISALPELVRVILLGDRDQLASVEAGAVLGDICYFAEAGYSVARAIELSRLTGCLLRGKPAKQESAVQDSICLLRKSYRFDSRSGIGQLAQAINVGDVKRVREVISGHFNDVKVYQLATNEEYQEFLEACVLGYHDYLNHALAGSDPATVLDAFSVFQVLCALRVGLLGVTGMNQQIEYRLHHAGLINHIHDPWYLGRPVMIKRNDYSLALYNGDIGIALLDERCNLRVHFLLPDGSIKLVHPKRLPAHETAYAMTIHKSQGSEFDHVVLVLPNQFLSLLTRELVYTAVTRARSGLLLYTTDKVLMQAICATTKRSSGLVERLLN